MDAIKQHEYHKEVGLNDYERFYFRRFFHENLDALERFRKNISNEQKKGIYRGEPYVVRHFKINGDKLFYIKLSRKKVDAYIREVKEKLDKK
jgi:hypothetical protein